MIFTYIGDGNLPPAAINFMGRQEFDLNVPQEVEDDELIEKLKGNKCFIEGKPDKKQKAAAAKAETVAEDEAEAAELAKAAAVDAPAAASALAPVAGVAYEDMLTALKAKGVKPKSRKKDDVVEAYEKLAA